MASSKVNSFGFPRFLGLGTGLFSKIAPGNHPNVYQLSLSTMVGISACFFRYFNHVDIACTDTHGALSAKLLKQNKSHFKKVFTSF